MAVQSPSQSPYVNPAEAAHRLGVSVKALRIYERVGLLTPVRTAAGWRTYGPAEMKRAAEIVAFRGLGFSLAQIARVLKGDARALEPALAAHQAALEGEARRLAETIDRLRGLRADLADGVAPSAHEAMDLLKPKETGGLAFDLPWPWGGERFVLRDIPRLTFITGPLGSGKTRLAQRLAAALPNAAFLGLDRAVPGAGIDANRKARIDAALNWIVDDGGSLSDALTAIVAGLETDGPDALVIDMIEQGLDQATQEALMAYLRRGRRDARPLFMLTRSSIILDLASVGPDEAIVLCPANHDIPICVAPHPGSPGYEAVATCLATPDVRARTAGVIAFRP